MPTLYENYIIGDIANYGFNTYWAMQTFTPSIAHTISQVILLLSKNYTPAFTLTVSIRVTDESGCPTGEDLCSGTISSADIPQATFAWKTITFGTGIALSAGTKYAIVVRKSGSVVTVSWRYLIDSPTYTGGEGGWSTDGSDWNLFNTSPTKADFMFEEWGDLIAVPTATTQAITNIVGTTATGNGTIISLGGADVTQHGHCWNTTGSPTVASSKTENGAKSSTGAFTSNLTGLTSGTKYYVRAYATNAGGTGYGSDVIFTAGEGVYPSEALSRVGSIRHFYQPGTYRMELQVGGLTTRPDVVGPDIMRILAGEMATQAELEPVAPIIITPSIIPTEPMTITLIKEIQRLDKALQVPGISDYSRQVLAKRILQLRDELSRIYPYGL